MSRYEFDWDPEYLRAARPFGITPQRAYVDVDGERLHARYGRWSLTTALDNVREAVITGPYRFIKTAGPPRLGVTDFGLTYASNGRRGVLISFHRRVRSVGLIPHGELTVTVAEPKRLQAELQQRVDVLSRG